MEVEIKSGFSIWISFTDTKQNMQLAMAIYDSKKRHYIGRIRKPSQDLFDNNVEEFSYPSDTKEWDVASDLKRRIKNVYSDVHFVDNTFRWPMSQKMADDWEKQRLQSIKSNDEHWAKERKKLEFAKMVKQLITEVK